MHGDGPRNAPPTPVTLYGPITYPVGGFMGLHVPRHFVLQDSLSH